ncbi:Hpt domain-containing protein [Qiania dongpingensis]|uniref:Hpt domain-containing protein n=1 Tax=Qiania dongpingensis TaxID=2763669 RepID=A0A7G9G1X6_9FIRM|nr:Hpt domain-containing protein [Qiania dongpingensis]QNM04808.1 Hpt domain-containing protein [Qiania dongpingensis]
MSGFRETFEAYGGDYQNTMARFLENEAFYLRLLNMLFQDDNMEKLGESLRAGDLTGAFEAAHTLKGVVGNLGLVPLYAAVCAVVEPLRNREERSDYAAMYDVIRTEFQNVENLRQDLMGGN